MRSTLKRNLFQNQRSKPTQILEPIVKAEFNGSLIVEIIQNIYPVGFYFILESWMKTRKYYEFILIDTKSVEITHIPNKNYAWKIAYSKLKNFKVLNPTHWNQSIFTEENKNPFKAIQSSNLLLERLY